MRQLPAVTAAHLRIYVVMALLNVAIPYLVLAYVAPKLPASLLPIGLALVPGVIYLMALAFQLERLGWLRFGGIGLGLAGVLLILLPKASLPELGMAGWLRSVSWPHPAFRYAPSRFRSCARRSRLRYLWPAVS